MASSQPKVWVDISSKCLTLDHDCVLTQKNISLGKNWLKKRLAEVQEAFRPPASMKVHAAKLAFLSSKYLFGIR